MDTEILRFHFHTDEAPRAVAPFVLSYTDITYLIDGELTYFYNGSEILLRAGEAIVFPAGAKRERRASEKRATFASLNLVFPKGKEPPLAGVIGGAANAEAVYILKLLYECYRTESPRRQEKCASLLSFLLSRLAEDSEGGGNAYVRAVKQMVLDRPYRHYTLAEVAEAVHLAPGYLCALFKKHEGMHLFEYIARKRIDYAKKQIISFDIPLSEVAQRSGFSDHYAFSHAFKRYEGISAAQYKKSVRQKD